MALVQFALCDVIGRVPTEGSNPRVRACDKMGFYQDQIVPLLINWSMRQKNLAAYRARIIPAAEGRVLEIGIGSGLNLPFYSRNVARVIGLEPSPRLLAMARQVERTGNGSVEFIERERRHRRDDLDLVQHSRRPASAPRHASGAPTHWASVVCRARSCA